MPASTVQKATARHHLRRVQPRRHGPNNRISTTAAIAIRDHATETGVMRSNYPTATPTYCNVPERTNTYGHLRREQNACRAASHGVTVAPSCVLESLAATYRPTGPGQPRAGDEAIDSNFQPEVG